MGTGAAIKTAWVEGDDALLVLDRDNNGRIDSGAELFGEATPVGEMAAEDGFAALAELDRPALGGNGDGRIGRCSDDFAHSPIIRCRNREEQAPCD